MNYQESIDWVYAQLPIFQRDGAAAYKPGLQNTIALMEMLGNPEQQFESIHIAGTNGKGSVTHMLAALFQSAGYKTGLYTSPHLKQFEERIKINGEMIPQKEVSNFMTHYKEQETDIKPSFFELTMAMAFDYFAQNKVDIAIIETGMGGRLDSTNVLIPKLSIITNVSLDHQAYLGDTIEAIAYEKAGIIKPNAPALIGERQTEIVALFTEKAKQAKTKLLFADETPISKQLNTGELLGSYQIHNRQTVYSAYLLLQKMGYDLDEKHLTSAFNKVVQLTGLRGRYETLQNNPKIIADTGHNAAAMDYLIPQLMNERFDKLHLVLGFVNDKDVTSILNYFPKNAQFYFCKPDIPRGLDASETQKIAVSIGLNGSSFSTVKDALNSAKQKAKKDDLIFVGGSTFVVAEVIE